MPICKHDHRHWGFLEDLQHDQGGIGRHKCAGCAYQKGYDEGLRRAETLDMGLDDLPESQAGAIRHKSPHAAYALGYHNGVEESYNNG